jgi:hypothetical protein
MFVKWDVGDLCTAIYNSRGDGVIYRVFDVEEYSPSDVILYIQPALSLFTKENQPTRRIASHVCKKIDVSHIHRAIRDLEDLEKTEPNDKT